jgi:hypothetical protein
MQYPAYLPRPNNPLYMHHFNLNTEQIEYELCSDICHCILLLTLPVMLSQIVEDENTKIQSRHISGHTCYNSDTVQSYWL